MVDPLREKAEKIAKNKVDFYTHLTAYIAVNLFMVMIWWTTSGPGSFPWFIFVLFGWGIGLAAHFVETFAAGGFMNRLAEKEYQKLKRK